MAEQSGVILDPGGAEYKKGKVKRSAIERLRDFSESNYGGSELERVSASLATVLASRMEATLEDVPDLDKERLTKYNNGFVGALMAMPEWNDRVLDILEENRERGMAWYERTSGLDKAKFDVWWDGMVAEAVAGRLWKKTVGGEELIQDADLDAHGLDFYDVVEIRRKRYIVGLQIKSASGMWPDDVKVERVVVDIESEGAVSSSADSWKYRRKMVSTLEHLSRNKGIEIGMVLKVILGVKGLGGWRELMKMVENKEVVRKYSSEIMGNLETLGY